jgi:hypothetical protein
MAASVERCGKWMPKAMTYCGRVPGHNGKCVTPETWKRMNDQSVLYHRSRTASRRDALDQYKLERGCVDCGYRKDPIALDFDHREPSLKTANLSEMLHHSWSKVLAEIAKCDVRCANCHRIRTFGRTTAAPGENLLHQGPQRD